MSSKQPALKKEGTKTSKDRGRISDMLTGLKALTRRKTVELAADAQQALDIYAKLEPSKKPAFLELYQNVKKDDRGKTSKPLLAEYTREMQERTSHGVESEEGLFYAAKLLSLNGISWQVCGGDDKPLHLARQLARGSADENGHNYQEIECSTQMLTHFLRAQVWCQAGAFS